MNAPSSHRARNLQRRLSWTCAAALVVVVQPRVGVADAAVPVAAVNNPPVSPHSVIVFPQRDFVSASGFTTPGQTVTVQVVHPNGTVLSTQSGLVPLDDPKTPGFDGLVEVNHPGGYCWQTTTPDIRPGDRVQVVDDATAVADETTTADITNQRPVQTAPDTVVVHGTATQADGTPIPIDQLEQRLVANRQAFDLNGTRTLRAASVPARRAGGLLTYDAPGATSWTATYTGLDQHDVTMALGSESVGLWLGNPVGTVEATHYEVGAGIAPGPAAPCTAPLEKLPPPPGSDQTAPSTPTALRATVANNNTVTLDWTAATDDIGVTSYGIYRDGTAIDNVQNPDGSAPAPTTYVDRNVPPGTYTYTVDAADAAGNRSPLSDGADATATAAPAPAVTANEPPTLPVSIISFPSRDFVSPSGFLPTDTVDISVIRDGKVISTANGQIPQDDPKTDGFDGLVEVNHPGGGCWEGMTPEIRPGDVIRTKAFAPDGSVRTIDQTRTANVTATRVRIVTPASSATSRDGVVEVHGTAAAPNGRPLPLDQVDQRLVANRDAFDLNGRRTLRAPGDGTLSYDGSRNPLGVNWTATYSGLSSNDVYRAAGGTSLTGRTFAGAESRALWLGANPLSGQELTIFENSPDMVGGPAAGVCGGTAETADSSAPSVPTNVSATQTGANNVKVDWSPSSDNWYVAGYRVLRDGSPIADVGGSFNQAGDSTSTYAVGTSYTDTGVPPGPHTYSVVAYDNASPQGLGATELERLTAGLGQPMGNVSGESTPVSMTQADVTAPSVPGNLTASVSGHEVSLSWSASTDDVGVTSYRVYRRDATGSSGSPAPWALQAEVSGGTSFTDSNVPSGSYEYTVEAADAAGNVSGKAAPPIGATVSPDPDTLPPSSVTGLSATNSPTIHGRDVKITWDAATDNVGVTSYGVYRDGVKIADVTAPTTTYTDTNRPAGSYDYTVDAADSAGNRSTRPPAVTVVVADDPPVAPHDVIAFPARDFISATGYTPGRTYRFSVIRGSTTLATSSPVVADPTGLVEVNHPGGGCWTTVTPNVQAGDVIRISDGGSVVDQTTVAGITAERPVVTALDPVTGGGTVQVRGTAQDSSGRPLPVGQIEQRLIANRDAFDLNGRRTVRAGGAGSDGSLAYDGPGSIRWTATYTFQTPNDLARAVGGTSTSGVAFTGAESRILWLGRDPLAGVESTIFENGPGVTGGPTAVAGCTSGAAETPAPGASLSAQPTFADTAVGSTSAAQSVTLTNTGTAPLHIDRAYLAGLNPGDFTLGAGAANGATVAPGASVSVTIQFKPTVAGTRQANVSFADDAANTTDQTIRLVGSTPVAAAPTATAPVQSLAAGNRLVVSQPLSASTIAVDLRWTGTGSRSELQMATGSSTNALGGFTPVTLSPDTATSTSVRLAMGGTTGTAYQFRVRTCNAGTCGAWATGPKFTLAPADDTQLAASTFKGTWTSENIAGSYGGSVRWSASGNATVVPGVTFTVSGNAAWVSTLGPDRGLAQVQVDGQTPQVVDLYSPTLQPAQVVWARDALAAGTHTVTVTPLGKKSTLNPAACNTGVKCARVDIDAGIVIR